MSLLLLLPGELGVLKVWDGTDWRKIGCADGGTNFTDTFTRTGLIGAPWVDAPYKGKTVTWSTDGDEAYISACTAGFDHTTGIRVWQDQPYGYIEAVFSALGQYQGLSVQEQNLAYGEGGGWYILCSLDTSNRMKIYQGDGFTLHTSSALIPGFTAGDTVRLTLGETGGAWTALLHRNGVQVGSLAITTPPMDPGPDGLFWRWQLYGAAVNAARWASATIVTPGTPVEGRLKLWTGTGWAREACPGESGQPLKVWDGIDWVTVACMTPA